VTPVGPIGRLGRWTATHFRAVLFAWLLIALGLGFFAPRVEHALSGAGWEAAGSESVQAREAIDRELGGHSGYGLMVVVHSDTMRSGDPA
jgi:RND superfamily putative drug exporter